MSVCQVHKHSQTPPVMTAEAHVGVRHVLIVKTHVQFKMYKTIYIFISTVLVKAAFSKNTVTS